MYAPFAHIYIPPSPKRKILYETLISEGKLKQPYYMNMFDTRLLEERLKQCFMHWLLCKATMPYKVSVSPAMASTVAPELGILEVICLIQMGSSYLFTETFSHAGIQYKKTVFLHPLFLVSHTIPHTMKSSNCQ